MPLNAHVRIQDQVNMEMYSFKNLAARDEVKASEDFVSLVKVLWGVTKSSNEAIDEEHYKEFLRKCHRLIVPHTSEHNDDVTNSVLHEDWVQDSKGACLFDITCLYLCPAFSLSLSLTHGYCSKLNKLSEI